jgi:hypothetical protein
MTRQEIVQLLSIATANFPSTQKQDMKATLILWEKALADIPYAVAENAVIKVLSTSKYFPTIAEIRESATQLTQPRKMDAMEAWEQIVLAIRKHGLYDQEKAMQSLSPDVRAMAKRFTWRELCLNENPDTLRAQFRMAWETESKRHRETASLPPQVKHMLDSVVDNMRLDKPQEVNVENQKRIARMIEEGFNSVR